MGTARSTGNAINDPHTSNLATLTVNPTISVTSHPSNQEVAEGLSATFTASATASDGSESRSTTRRVVVASSISARTSQRTKSTIAWP